MRWKSNPYALLSLSARFLSLSIVLLFGAALEGHYRDIAVAFGRKFQYAPFKNAQQPFDEALIAFVAAPPVGNEYAV